MSFAKQLNYQFTKSVWNYWAGIVSDGLFGCLFIAYAVYLNTYALFIAVIGFFTFSLVEYFFHRYLFHVWPRATRKGHAMHHFNPYGMDSMPFISGLVIFSVSCLPLLWVSLYFYCAFVGGLMLGYMTYALFHHLIHRIKPKKGYVRYMINFHDYHHKVPSKNFGVTNPVWDFVFRSYEKPQ